jgi:class 3 adenylate cyclase/tetratricopeptide (TPR) repeat protein
MSEIRKWLEAIGLGQYADAFETNDIDMDLIRQIDDQALRDLGMTSAGHRLRVRNATAKLTAAPVAEVNLCATIPTRETTAASAERRQVTVMFCDLVGSTALSARLDPEDLRGVVGAYHRCCTELVERNGGFVAKYMGDGVLAYFGYPQAYEHDAERAVRAGLALVEAVPKLTTNAGSPLQVRVGIATGVVVVGDLIGAGAAQEQAVVGETPNLAARLQALAEPGAVLISSSTRRLIGGLFEYRDLGMGSVKGFGDQVLVWQVIGASGVDSRFEALRTATTPVVGRDEETELLMRRWQQAKGGEGSVALISGEPGIGKSRIVQSVLERIQGEQHVRLRYFCSPHHQDTALYPMIRQLERTVKFRREDTAEQRLGKLKTVLALATNDLSEALPLAAELLSIPIRGGYSPLKLSPQQNKKRLFRALLAQVEGLAAQQPVLMVFEDVHWIDPTSRELLDLVIDRVPKLRLLAIITFRPEFTPPWIGRPHVTLLSLSRLPPRQRAEMILQVTRGKALPKEIADQIVDRTDGVPLFIEELTKAVVESGVVVDAGDRYTVTGPKTALGIPPSLHASLLARLDHLGPVREVVQIGAALGRSFSHELISAVAPMPQPQLDGVLAQLVNTELIFRSGIPPDAEYTFKHALVQDAAYSTLLRNRRQQLHARIAATLEGQFREIGAAQPALLAQHCAEAGLPKKAIVYWLKAGQQAKARSAMTEAVAQLRKGLDVLSTLPDDLWRWQQELELQMALRPALAATKGLSTPEVGETIARALELAGWIDRPEYLVPVLIGQYAYHLVRAEYKLALSFAERIEKIGEARNDVAIQLSGRRRSAYTRLRLGEFIAARALLERCHDLADPTHRALAGSISDDPYSSMLVTLAVTLTYLGHFDQARLRKNEALSEAHRLGHTQASFVLLDATWAELVTRADESQRHAKELLALSIEHGFPMHLGWATAFRGRCLTALGQAQEGLTLLLQGLATIRTTGFVMGTPYVLLGLAEAYVMLDRPVEGLNYLAEAAHIIETTEERIFDAELYLVRGEFLDATGDRPAAEQSYHQALAVAKRQSAKLFELRAATSLARLWRDQGKRTEARDLLAPIYSWFVEGFDTPVLKDAKALLDQLT